MKRLLRKLLLTACSLFYFCIPIHAADFYWVGGTGNWSDFINHWATISGGGVFHATVPGPGDNVFFDNNSFTANDTVYADVPQMLCMSMDWTGAPGTPVFYNQVSAVLTVSGTLTLISGMQLSGFSSIYFNATTGGNQVTAAGRLATVHLSFNGPGSYSLADSLDCTELIVNNGQFYSNDYAINCQYLGIQDSNAVAFYFGQSVITVSTYCFFLMPGIMVDADSAILTCGMIAVSGQHFKKIVTNGINADNSMIDELDINLWNYNQINNSIIKNAAFTAPTTLTGSGNHYWRAAFMDDAQITGNNTFDSLYFNKPGSRVTLSGSQTINNVFEVNATCGAGMINIYSQQMGVPSYFIKNSGTVTLDQVVLQDIIASGGALFTANNSAGKGITTGWTINTPSTTTLYWVGGAGNWSDQAHWAVSSGGAGGNCSPSPWNHVVIDQNSFTAPGETLIVDVVSANCYNLDLSAVNNQTVIFSGNQFAGLNVFGSLAISDQVTMDVSPINMVAGSGINTITTGAVKLLELQFMGSGTWMLTDSLHADYINFYSGHLITANNPVQSWQFILAVNNSSGSLDLGTSYIQTEYWSFYDSLAVSGDSSRIDCLEFNGGPVQNYGEINIRKYGFISGLNYTVRSAELAPETEISGSGIFFSKAVFTDNGYIEGSHTFDTLISTLQSCIFEIGDTVTINNYFHAAGDCQVLMTLKSLNPVQPALLFSNAGNIQLDYAVIRNTKTSGTGNFTAVNSLADSASTGWNIVPLVNRNLFWVGGKGNWNDPIHWSLTSGGPGGNCPPSLYDDVFFDVNSFTGSGDTVFQDSMAIYMHDMNWTGALHHPVFFSNYFLDDMNVYGSLILIQDMEFNYGNWGWYNEINMRSDSVNTIIQTAGHPLIPRLNFDGYGNWTIADSLETRRLQLTNGFIYTDSKPLKAESIQCFPPVSGGMFLGTSIVNCWEWNVPYANTLIAGDSSTIITTHFRSDHNQVYGYVSDTITLAIGSIINQLNVRADGSNVLVDVAVKNMIVHERNELYAENSYIEHLMLTGPVNISGVFTVDTLYCNFKGDTLRLEDSLTVNQSFLSIADSAGPIVIQSGVDTVQAVLLSPAGNMICLDYIHLKSIAASGGAVFYAGDHSLDLGNNTGWIWSSCFTSVDELNSSTAVSVYPNPVKDVLQISVPHHQVKEINLISLEGKAVMTQSGKISYRLNVSELVSGMYILEVRTQDALLRRKILITH